jgi:hypothetical protein
VTYSKLDWSDLNESQTAPINEVFMSEESGNNDSSSSPESSDTPVVESPAESIQEQVRKFKVKVNGSDMEVDEAELIAGYQTRKAADEKFREAAMSRKQAEEFIHMLQVNPLKVLQDPRLGHDARKLAEEFLMSQYEEESMDPRDRELRDAKAQLQAIEEEKKRIQTEQEEAQKAELVEKYQQDIQGQIISTLESSGLPKSPHTVKRMAYYMHQGLQRGMSLTAQDVVSLVKNDYIQEQKALFGSLDGELLIQMLGDDVATKIRKHDISKIKSPQKQLSTPAKQAEGSSRPASKQEKKMSMEDWKEKMAKLRDEK